MFANLELLYILGFAAFLFSTLTYLLFIRHQKTSLATDMWLLYLPLFGIGFAISSAIFTIEMRKGLPNMMLLCEAEWNMFYASLGGSALGVLLRFIARSWAVIPFSVLAVSFGSFNALTSRWWKCPENDIFEVTFKFLSL